MGNIMEEAFTAYTGSEKVFTLNGKELVIPARFDAFITYRTKFMKLAKACADKAAEILRDKMENAVELSVPLTVELGIGKTWFEQK